MFVRLSFYFSGDAFFQNILFWENIIDYMFVSLKFMCQHISIPSVMVLRGETFGR